jgi:hypothetical protein
MMQPVRAGLGWGRRPVITHAIAEKARLGESMRSTQVIDIALAAFAIVLISALLIAFVSLH